MAMDDDTGQRPPGDASDAGRPAGAVDADAFVQLSTALRDAFAQVTSARLHPDESARWQRRLIAITTVAKRDLAKALDNMERFQADWRKRRR